MAVKGEKVQKFLWKVENYSYCWNKTDDFIQSPEFQMDIFEGSSWYLKLYPRGVSAYEKYVSVHLERSESSGGPFAITVDYEISLLRPDGTAEYVKETKDRCFRKGYAFGFDNLAVREEILETKRASLLPEDILTVQCLIFPKEAELKTYSEIIAKTRIELQRSVFVWKSVNNFPDRQYEHKRWFLPNTKRKYVTLKLYWPDDYLVMCFFDRSDFLKVIHYKIGILDSNNSVSWILVDKQMDHNGTSDIFRIHRNEILRQKSLYLPNDKLTLHCDLKFSFGFQHSHVEKVYDEDALIYAPASNLPAEVNVSRMDYSYHFTDDSDSFKSNFLNLYQEGELCDFTIKVGNENIHAHKVVLGARSPVFKAMLTSKMKENERNMVDISDLEVNTVRHMLTFIYTDTTADLDWHTASKLYFAADKYGLMKLRRICTNVMKQNLCVSNIGEALCLANLHGDDKLKNLTLEFILSHDTEVICSKEWKAFMTEEVQLAAEAMHCVFIKKAENNRGRT